LLVIGRTAQQLERGGRRGDVAAPAHDSAAYLVAFDGEALAVGESLPAAPGVTLTRRC